MLNRLLLVVDALLIAALVALAFWFYAAWAPSAAPTPEGRAPTRPVDGGGPAAPLPPATPLPLSAFSSIATNNLFNPLRTEESPAPASARPAEKGPAAPAPPRPRLYGIVMGTEGGGLAFLEDPRTRRIGRYAVGDSVADSRVEEVKPDRVVLRRGGEVFEVLLRDPSKPRPVPAAPGTPGAPGAVPPGTPGRPSGPGGLALPGAPGGAGVGAAAPGASSPGAPPTSPGVTSGPAGRRPGPGFPGFLPTTPGMTPPGGPGPAPEPPGVPVDPGIPPTS